MTAFLIALVIVVGAVAVLNLLLTFGMVRRLRQHTEQLSTLHSHNDQAPAVMLEAGRRVGEFAVTTTDGEPVSRDLLSGPTLVGAFTPGCHACEERLPEFVARAVEFPGGRAQVLAVVAGLGDQEIASYRDRLTPVARVVVEEPEGGQLATALGVAGFPSFALLDGEGMVVASGYSMAGLPLVSPSAA